MIRALFLVVMLFGLTAAREPVLVPDVSQREVDIVYSFTGAELLLFGAILYPDGQAPTGDADIAVVLRGPTTSMILREKRKLFGLIWANADSTRFQSVPGYYAIATSRPLEKLIDERTSAIYELGLGNIQLSPSEAESPERQRRFENGLIALRQKTELFADRPGSVEITKGVLYRARLYIPARVPTGRYVAETFLIRNGKIIAAATRDVEIRKLGFERFVARAAETAPFTYGLAAVGLSLAFGFAASAIFKRF
ncbi:MAG: TIGR02186 family protein [Pseudomonadota bacterium]